MNQFTTGSVDASAKLKQDRELSDRAFTGLSANQRAQLDNEAARLGISSQQLYYDTGLRGGGGAVLPQQGAPQQATPSLATPVTPAAVQPVAPAAVRSVAPAAVRSVDTSGKPIAKPLIDTVSPRERQVLMVAQPKEIVAAQSSLQNMERLMNVADELKDHPGLKDIVGRVNQYQALDLTDNAVNARALQSTLVKQSAVNALQAMRDASKTGGAVGAVSEKEWPILEQQLAALNGAQTKEAYRTALTNLVNQLSSSSKRIKNAYEITYGKLEYEATPYQKQSGADDQAALQWANANPNDPRAAAIKKRLGK
jgi:hypothetical protein